MYRSRPILPSLAALALVLAACAGGGTPSEAASEQPPASVAPSEVAEPSVAPEPSAAPSEVAEDEFTVTLSGFAFSIGQLTVPAGTEVRFENADTAAHTVTEGTDGRAAADPVINAQVGPGAATTFTFDEPGEYQITCLFHPSMNMTVVVEG